MAAAIVSSSSRAGISTDTGGNNRLFHGRPDRRKNQILTENSRAGIAAPNRATAATRFRISNPDDKLSRHFQARTRFIQSSFHLEFKFIADEGFRGRDNKGGLSQRK